jgi:hypothetical protein
MEPVAQQQLHVAAAAGNDAPAAAADRPVCICTAGADAGDEERSVLILDLGMQL